MHIVIEKIESMDEYDEKRANDVASSLAAKYPGNIYIVCKVERNFIGKTRVESNEY